VWFIPLVDKRGWQVKLCDPSLARTIVERFRDESIKRYTNLQILYILVGWECKT